MTSSTFNQKNKAYILALSTQVPKTFLSQKNIIPTLQKSLSLDENKALKLQSIFDGSNIKKRHTVIEDFNNPKLEGDFFGAQYPKEIPCLEKRNELYKLHAPTLASAACKTALTQWGKSKDSITHIISVSCTGMYAPGIEFGLIETLGLPPSTERLGINFMGCFGAFKGLAIAKSLAAENPKNRVLLVCTELCSLHFQSNQDSNTFVANALFSDGAAAVIIGCDPSTQENSLFNITKQSSLALKNSQDLMTWEISKHGMLMTLSKKIPSLICKQAQSFAKDLLGPAIPFSSCSWAVHPGGKAIIKAVEKACSLEKKQTESSWETLWNYGNMSSPTFLFVLESILQKNTSKEWVLGMGFGPGISFEGILLKKECR